MPRRLSVRLELERHAIDAVAQTGRRWAVREYVTQMATAGRAMHFGAKHAERPVVRCLDRSGNRVIEARPAGAAFEFQRCSKQFLITPDAPERAGTMFMQQ